MPHVTMNWTIMKSVVPLKYARGLSKKVENLLNQTSWISHSELDLFYLPLDKKIIQISIHSLKFSN